MLRMSKVITPHFEELIDRFVATGRFNNKSEVIRAGLRLLEEHEAKASPSSREDLERVIHTALMDPRPLIPAASLVRRRNRQCSRSLSSSPRWPKKTSTKSRTISRLMTRPLPRASGPQSSSKV
jgi:antitoxin ParD1/3/4